MMALTLQQIIIAFLAISVRLSGLMLFAPFFGSAAVAPRVKAGLVLAGSALLYPMLQVQLASIQLATWPRLVVTELVIGTALGIATNLVFDAVQMAGQTLSTQMGFSLINILDPQTEVESTVMAQFHQTIALLIFLRLNVHLWLLRSVAKSFALIPPGSAHVSAAFTSTLVNAAGSVFSLGVQLAAPVLSATFLCDVALGLLGKASPQAPIMLLGPPLKTLLGISVLLLALKYWPAILDRVFLQSLTVSNQLLLEAR